MTSSEAKFEAYSKTSFTDICVGMKVNKDVKWIRISYSAPSLLSVVQGDTYNQLNIGRTNWKSLLASPTLQENCNKEGFNVRAGTVNVRLGVISNNEAGCDSSDSWLGFGAEIIPNILCGVPSSTNNSCGNVHACANVDTKAFGMILVK